MRKNIKKLLGFSSTFFTASALFVFASQQANAQFISSPFKTASFTGSSTAAVKLVRLSLEDGFNREEAVITFDNNSNASAGFEDETYIGGSPVSVSTLSKDDIALSLNRMPDLNQDIEIGLNIDSRSSASLTLKAEYVDLGSCQVILQDSYLNKQIDLNENTTYNLVIDKKNPSSYSTNRFKLLFFPQRKNLAYALLNYQQKAPSDLSDKDMLYTSTYKVSVLATEEPQNSKSSTVNQNKLKVAATSSL
ncbi:hypothetical protein [Rubrolithibacter danxiaensis]|uniref:hypothetical protein n=1 Tax=Rubrolithibacter danxiaensis TaxID=3390805 RepID=UPI003BF7FC8E